MQVLPVAQASSLRGGITSTTVKCWPWSLLCRHEPGATKHLRAGIACMPDRLDDRYEYTFSTPVTKMGNGMPRAR